LSSSKQGSF